MSEIETPATPILAPGTPAEHSQAEHPQGEVLAAHACGDLEPGDADRVARHAAECPACARELSALRALDEELAALGRVWRGDRAAARASSNAGSLRDRILEAHRAGVRSIAPAAAPTRLERLIHKLHCFVSGRWPTARELRFPHRIPSPRAVYCRVEERSPSRSLDDRERDWPPVCPGTRTDIVTFGGPDPYAARELGPLRDLEAWLRWPAERSSRGGERERRRAVIVYFAGHGSAWEGRADGPLALAHVEARLRAEALTQLLRASPAAPVFLSACTAGGHGERDGLDLVVAPTLARDLLDASRHPTPVDIFAAACRARRRLDGTVGADAWERWLAYVEMASAADVRLTLRWHPALGAASRAQDGGTSPTAAPTFDASTLQALMAMMWSDASRDEREAPFRLRASRAALA